MRRAAFIVASIVVPVVANGFRVLGIVALGHYMGSARAVEADHVVYGWVFFSAVILLLIVLGLPFRQDHGAWTVPDVPMAPTLHASRQALFGMLAMVVLAAIGPALAARIDRTSTDVVVDLPLPAPPADCVVQPMRAADVDAPAARFVCAKGAVMLTVQVFAPRASVAQLLGSQRRLIGAVDGEDVETRLVGTWLLTVPEPPGKPVAICLWIDGQPATLGLATRMRQAWHNLFGAPYRPVLLAVSADEPDRRWAEQSLIDFLQTQSVLGKYAMQLSTIPKSGPAVGSVHPAPG
jgi:hypothetical protein